MKTFLYSIILFCLLSFIFLGHYYFVGQAVYGDGIYYWSYTRSLWKDRNLDLRNEINHHYSPRNNNQLEKENYSGKQVQSWFPIGVSLSWIPAFAMADTVANFVHSFNHNFPNNGYSNIYQIFVGLFNVFLVTLGMIILLNLLCMFFPVYISTLAAITWLFSSNLLYYSAIDVLNSHPLTFFLSTLFVFLWYKTQKKRTIRQWIFLGIILGLLSISRTQELLFGAFLLFDIFRERKNIKKIFIPFTLTIFTVLIIYSAQIFVWQAIYRSYFINPYLTAGFSIKLPHIFDVIWSDKNGVLRWTPIFLFGFIGLLVEKNKIVWRYSLFFIIAQFFLISSWVGMNYGGSYGMRLFLSSSYAFALGLGNFFEIASRTLGLRWGIIFAVMLCIFNMTNIVYFLLFVQ